MADSRVEKTEVISMTTVKSSDDLKYKKTVDHFIKALYNLDTYGLFTVESSRANFVMELGEDFLRIVRISHDELHSDFVYKGDRMRFARILNSFPEEDREDVLYRSLLLMNKVCEMSCSIDFRCKIEPRVLIENTVASNLFILNYDAILYPVIAKKPEAFIFMVENKILLKEEYLEEVLELSREYYSSPNLNKCEITTVDENYLGIGDAYGMVVPLIVSLKAISVKVPKNVLSFLEDDLNDSIREKGADIDMLSLSSTLQIICYLDSLIDIDRAIKYKAVFDFLYKYKRDFSRYAYYSRLSLLGGMPYKGKFIKRVIESIDSIETQKDIEMILIYGRDW